MRRDVRKRDGSGGKGGGEKEIRGKGMEVKGEERGGRNGTRPTLGKN